MFSVHPLVVIRISFLVKILSLSQACFVGTVTLDIRSNP